MMVRMKRSVAQLWYPSFYGETTWAVELLCSSLVIAWFRCRLPVAKRSFYGKRQHQNTIPNTQTHEPHTFIYRKKGNPFSASQFLHTCSLFSLSFFCFAICEIFSFLLLLRTSNASCYAHRTCRVQHLVETVVPKTLLPEAVLSDTNSSVSRWDPVEDLLWEGWMITTL